MKYLFIFLFTFPALAHDPTCTMQTRGNVQCMADVMCECIYQRPGTMTNDPGGHRWDCGINRPPCLEYKKIESDNKYDGPQAVAIDKSTEVNSEIGDNSPSEININPSTTVRTGQGDDGISTIDIQN